MKNANDTAFSPAKNRPPTDIAHIIHKPVVNFSNTAKKILEILPFRNNAHCFTTGFST
jgi:hypothetical protein